MSDLFTDIVLYVHPQRQQEAERLARRFNLPLTDGQRKNKYRLYLAPDRLELQHLNDTSIGTVVVDFVAGRARHRRLFGGGKRQPLARAVGIKGSFLPRVLDATAGFGRDAFVLAGLGCQVTMLERSAVFAALLEDAMLRAVLHHETTDIIHRMRLHYADAREFIATSPDAGLADTIYMDPMYPARTKTALVKKEMRIAREIAGEDKDAALLLEVALQSSAKRVVVKRPRGAPTLSTVQPAAAIQSENTRYDIYVRSVPQIRPE